MNIPGFSQESLDAVSAMLYAEVGQPSAEPCPPKPPPQPKPPSQPPQPPQPQAIAATQTDPQTQNQQQPKKPKCIPQQTSQTVNHSETFDFTRCVRPNGTAYGTRGKCRKGTEEAKETKGRKSKGTEEAKETKGRKSKSLFMAGSDVDFVELEKKAEEWRQEAGLSAFPGTIDWQHDMVHALVHEFLGGSNNIGEWIGQGSKSPTPAEETLVNMIHRAAALKGRGDDPKELLNNDLELRKYFERDINFLTGRGNIKDQYLKLYFNQNGEPAVDKFIQKIKEIAATPGFDKLLDAAHRVFTTAGEYVL